MKVSVFRPENLVAGRAAAARAKAASPETAATTAAGSAIPAADSMEGGSKNSNGGRVKTTAKKIVHALKSAAEKAAEAATETVKQIVPVPEKIAAIVECLRNPKIYTLCNETQLERLHDDIFNEKLFSPQLVFNVNGERQLYDTETGKDVFSYDSNDREIIVFQFFREGIPRFKVLEKLYNTFSFLADTDISIDDIKKKLETLPENYCSFVADIDGGGKFDYTEKEDAIVLYGEHYNSYKIVISGEYVYSLFDIYLDYKHGASKTYNMSVQDRKEYAKKQHGYISINSDSDSETETEKQQEKIVIHGASWKTLQQSNKKWKRLDDCAAYYCDLYNRIGQPIDFNHDYVTPIYSKYRTGGATIGKVFSDCVLGTRLYPEKEDSIRIYDKNDPAFVAALYGVAYAQASAVLKFCRDPQRSGKNSKGEPIEYNYYKGMIIPSNSGFSRVMLQLGNDIQSAAYELTHEAWVGLNAYTMLSRNGDLLYDSNGNITEHILIKAAADYWDKKIPDSEAVIIGDGWDIVQQAALTVWEESLEHGGEKYLESINGAIAAGKPINNFENLTKEQFLKVPEKYRNRESTPCFLNQWYVTLEQPKKTITDLKKLPEKKEVVINPMQHAFREARQVVQKNRNNQIASHKYTYLEMYIFSDDDSLAAFDVYLFRCGKYADIGAFSTESGKFTEYEKSGSVDFDNGKNLYTASAAVISDLEAIIKPIGLNPRQKLVLRYRFSGMSYGKIASVLGYKSKSSVRDCCKGIQTKWIKCYGEPENLWKYTAELQEPENAAQPCKDTSGNRVYTTPYFINGMPKKQRNPKQSENKSYTMAEQEKLAAQRAAWAAEKEYKAQQAALVKCTNTGAPKKLEPTGIHDPAAYRKINPITGRYEKCAPEKKVAVIPGNKWAASVIAVNDDGSRDIVSVVGDDSNRQVYDYLKGESYLQL